MLSCPRCAQATLPEAGYTTCGNCGASFRWCRATNTILVEHTDTLRPERLRLLVDGLRAARRQTLVRR